MATSWQEIKALAEDLKRAQLSSSAQRLSERDCIQIIQQLMARGQLQLIYTQDGRTFLTPEELSKEILEEVEAHEGRVNLVDVAAALGLDLCHLEARAQELLHGGHGLQLVLGQLVHSTYVRRVAQEVRELVREQGQVTLGALTKQYDLPSGFVRAQLVVPHLAGLLAEAQLDGERLYTARYLARHRARLRGHLSAALRPVAVASAAQLLGVDEPLLRKLLKELLADGQLRGQLAAGGAQYLPDCHALAQRRWVAQFFAQNGYLEWAALRRLGVAEPARFAAQHLPAEGVRLLASCALSARWAAQVEAAAREALRHGAWVELGAALPVCALSEEDLAALAQPLLAGHAGAQLLAGNSCVLSGALLTLLATELLGPQLAAAAERALADKALVAALRDGAGQQRDASRRDEQPADGRRAPAGGGKKGGGGGGSQGREVKTRATKKKYLSRGVAELEEPALGAREQLSQLGRYIPEADVESAVRQALAEAAELEPDAVLDELMVELLPLLRPKWQRRFEEALQSAFLQTSATAGGRAEHGRSQARLQSLYQHVHLFEKGAVVAGASAEGAVLRTELLRHLLRSLGAEMLNELVASAAAEAGLPLEAPTPLSAEARLKALSQLSSNRALHPVLLRLHQLVVRGAGVPEELVEFSTALNGACEQLGFLLRRPDKRQEKQLGAELAAQMVAQLEELPTPAQGGDAALLLLLAVSLCGQQASGGLPLHVPGRAVAAAMTWLAPRLSPDVHGLLVEFQQLVVRRLKAVAGGEATPEEASVALLALEERASAVRRVGLQWKKSGGAAKQ